MFENFRAWEVLVFDHAKELKRDHWEHTRHEVEDQATEEGEEEHEEDILFSLRLSRCAAW